METYLVHHGVQGQKWGERRYQNEDGSLTPEGRKHYGYGDRRKVVKTLKNDIQKLTKERSDYAKNNDPYVNAKKEFQKKYPWASDDDFNNYVYERDEEGNFKTLAGRDIHERSAAYNKNIQDMKAAIDRMEDDADLLEDPESAKKAKRVGGTVVGSILGVYGGVTLSAVTRSVIRDPEIRAVASTMAFLGGVSAGAIIGHKVGYKVGESEVRSVEKKYGIKKEKVSK